MEQLELSEFDLQKLIEKYGTTFYIYDGNKIKKNGELFMKTFKYVLPKFKQFFAVKALPNPFILQILADVGMGFDCSSPLEIILAKRFTDDIIYTSNFTSVTDLIFALENNVLINLDSIDGLYNLIEAVKISKLNLPDTICFRYNPSFDCETSFSKFGHLNIGGYKSKFGIDLNNLVKAYKLASEIGIKKFGIHIMIGSSVLNYEYWDMIINILFDAMKQICFINNMKFDFINLGGGIGINYYPTDEKIDLNILVSSINTSLQKYSKIYEIDCDNIYMECGRYITGPYGWFVSVCKSIKETDDVIFYGLDTTICNMLRVGIYSSSYHHIIVPRLKSEKTLIKSNVVGTLCENNDWFGKEIMLPIGIKKDDIFVIYNAGAHCSAMQSNYNGKLKCPELLIYNDNIIQIRKKQSIEDILREYEL